MIAQQLTNLRALGFIIGLKENGTVNVLYPGGKENAPPESASILDSLREHRAETVEHLKLYMAEAKAETLEMVNSLFEEGRKFYQYDMSLNSELSRAAGFAGILTVFREGDEARLAQSVDGMKYAVSADVFADLLVASVYDPASVRQLFNARAIFEGGYTE